MNVSFRFAVAGIAAILSFPALSEGPGLSRQSLGAESRGGVVSATAPRALAVGAVSHLLLPTSANVNGAYGAIFKTKVSIYNAVNATYEIRIGLSNSSGEIDHSYMTINPFQTVTFDNILQDVFGYYGGGAIDLNSGYENYRFIVSSQVYVDTGAGRYTTAVQFADDLGAITPARPGYIVGLSVNSYSRTNVGCASNSPYDQTISIQAYDAGGNLLGSPFAFTLRAWAWDQYAFAGSLTNGGIQIKATQNAVCYGVEVNNTSNDGTFQLATPF